MILGIDASNLRSGGGVTHIVNLLKEADPLSQGISKVIIWSNQATLAKIEERPWLVKSHQQLLDKGLLFRSLWQHFFLAKMARKENCDLLFVPGGSYTGKFFPVVTMCRNMLPFEPKEAMRFGRFNLMRLKMRLLRYTQSASFSRSDGVIFLTRYAQLSVIKGVGKLSCKQVIIPHGIEQRFLQMPRTQNDFVSYSSPQPFRFLYVSVLMPYKHQVEVATAVSHLRAEGLPIEMRFIGSSWGEYGRQFKRLVQSLDPNGDYLVWSGGEPFETLHQYYKDADAFVFASSCENLPNILIEAMAAGLPIACSDRGPMPEVLGEAATYFDPNSPESIAQAMVQLVIDARLRAKLAALAWDKAKRCTWKHCARETFGFITNVFDQTRDDSSRLSR